MEKKTIGIITLYDDINFGNKLQNYAVQVFFEKMGFDCYTVPYWEIVHPNNKIKMIYDGFSILTGLPSKRAAILRKRKRRRDIIKGFSDQYIKLDKMVHFSKLPDGFGDHFDYFVCGSDQIWHNWSGDKEELSFFFLRFTQEHKRLSIAPSFGLENIDDRYLKDYVEGLKGISLLTCREEAGKDMIEKISGRTAELILDPTMLIEESCWYDIIKKPDIKIPNNYILVYCLGEKDSKAIDLINRISHENNLEVIDLFSRDNDYYYIRPDEFLYFIQNASIVVTDSFHACVFSIIFKRPFVVYDRINRKMSSRIDTLLKTFCLQDRMITKLNYDNVLSADFEKCNEKMAIEREKAEKLYKDYFIQQ